MKSVFPGSQENQHTWVAEYCQSCRICIEKCPPRAIYHQPIQHNNSRVTHVDNALFFPYFNKYHSCSVCVAVCPFNQIPYPTLKESFQHLTGPPVPQH